ncbi:MAG: 3-oxoacyl-[acyl-carrier-protein] reductase [Candidatus Omnitrophica bacterium]|nr:3-oxoacyl-[acyl-carrier-protein] reductase [Candidatus Omnitrophota bacterium]MDE2009376.1 3-oxoacyl-[acyl-carrier-protein] reductase [Candidatus Omnitrophota bacterium]MDE2214160.1 3-oxoacyl-[acyl-carrier-protein] reductase [Candidatus Omnitrophota bacterium]MDE2231197.1 3-oxoacyl-[acyl-carrier-protein] reductase [Candidatus Omnitrophota bacterium]
MGLWSFKDEVVLVTGSTRGIGLGVAHAFAQEGAMVLIVGTNESMARQVAADFKSKGRLADGFGCDVTDFHQVQETVNKILDIHKRIDILVNNAGITRDNLLLRLDENDWDQVIKVNLKGTFNVTKAVGRAMIRAKKGRIINIASVIGLTGNIGQANYAASKAGIIAFSKSAAKEFAHRNITVNCVAPGYIRTDMTAKISEAVQQKVLERIPLSRFGEVHDVAGLCMFLASPAADYITGQTIVVDGGLTI